jgi:hypothetical protein
MQYRVEVRTEPQYEACCPGVRVPDLQPLQHNSTRILIVAKSLRACCSAIDMHCVAASCRTYAGFRSGAGPVHLQCGRHTTTSPTDPYKDCFKAEREERSRVHHVDVRREQQDQRPESSLRPARQPSMQRNEALQLGCRCPAGAVWTAPQPHLPAHLLRPQPWQGQTALCRQGWPAHLAGPRAQYSRWVSRGWIARALARRQAALAVLRVQSPARESDCAACWRRIHLNGSMCDLGWSPSWSAF